MKSIRIQLADEVHRSFKMYAAKNSTTMQDVVQDYILDLLKTNGWSVESEEDST